MLFTKLYKINIFKFEKRKKKSGILEFKFRVIQRKQITVARASDLHDIEFQNIGERMTQKKQLFEKLINSSDRESHGHCE